jgi:hypothetical protein
VVLLQSILCGESCLIVSWCVGDRCDMVGSNEDLGRSRRPGAEDRGWSSTGRVLGGWMIRRSCKVCTVHKEVTSTGFLFAHQNQDQRVSQFGLQNQQLWFGDLVLKITVTVSWFAPQN